MEKYYEIHDSGYNICCKCYCDDPKKVQKAVVFGHGFGGHKDNGAAARFARRAIAKHSGYAVITFDWPGHGSDVRKHLSLSDCDAYLDAVLRDTRQRFQTDALYGYATSFGGYLFLRYIGLHRNPFRKLALRCPAIDMYRVLTQFIADSDAREKLDKGKDALVGFDRKIKITPAFLKELQKEQLTAFDYTEYTDDCLILHGTADEIVPFEMAERFADDNLIELIPVDGADHRFRDQRCMDLAIHAILAFFEEAE